MPESVMLQPIGLHFTAPTVEPGCRKGRGKEGKGPKPDDVNKMLSVPWRQSLFSIVRVLISVLIFGWTWAYDLDDFLEPPMN